MQLPASPMSFSSNKINVSGSSVGSNSLQLQQQQQQQQQQQGASDATSLPIPQTGHVSIPMGPNNISHVDKKPRLDLKQDDVMQQQVLQQLFQRQDPTNQNLQLQALLQQQRLKQQQPQLLQSMSPSQRIQLQLQQQQQQQLRHQFQQQGTQQIHANIRLHENGVCVRRLMQYLYHQQQRPPDNSITYWRKFVAEYYSPRAKQRLCLSLYDSAGQHALGIFPQAAMNTWHCDLCGSKSGKGFEAPFEVLARLNETKFGSGIIDELLYLDYPRECRFPSGLMMLEYRKAVQETVHEQLRVVREGYLRILFTHDLKILSWEFCARRHEELLPRRIIAPQVNQVLHVAHKCQSTISESALEGVSQQDLQTNSNMILTVGRQLAKCLESQSLNDLGYPKKYIRTLQIAEVVKSMQDLIGFSEEHKVGPMDGLKKLSEQTIKAKLQRQNIQEIQQLTDAPNNSLTLPQGIMNSQMKANVHHQMIGRGALSGSAQAALALTNYQSMHLRPNQANIPNPNHAVHQHASTSSFTNPNPSPSSSTFQRQNLLGTGISSPHLSPQLQQQLQNRPINPNNILQQNHHSQSSQGNNNQGLQPQMIQQLLQEISDNNVGSLQEQSFSGQRVNNGNAERNGTPTTSNVSGGGGVGRKPPSRSNSFKAVSNGNNQRAQDLPQNLHMPEDTSVPEISHDFTDDGFFNNDDLYGL